MSLRKGIPNVAALLLAVVSAVSVAGTGTRREKVGGLDCMILENEFVRFVVVPEIGASVSEFTNKKTGNNYVAGNVGRNEDGTIRSGHGWVDYTRVPAVDGPDKSFGDAPYQAEFRAGKGYQAIVAECTIPPIRIEREMRLADNSPEVTVLIKQTNVGKTPWPLQVRWHPWCIIADTYAESSCVISPGEPGVIRKLLVGWGWDHWLYTHDGYWLAANYKTGEGLWMTFEKEKSEIHFTWTDYKQSRHPLRGSVTLEPYPMPVSGAPGESVSLALSYYPFTAEDRPETMSMGVLKDSEEIGRAREFLRIVKPNLEHIGPFTEVPPENPARDPFEANRFSHNHRRRDRMGLRPWGFVDAMLRPKSIHKPPQSLVKLLTPFYAEGPAWLNRMGLRVRYYAQMFPGAKELKKLTYRVTVTDPSGKVQLEKKSSYALHPEGITVVDERDQIALDKLPDGQYVFAVDVFEDGVESPIHQYKTLPIPLIGTAHAEFLKRGRQPWEERPFVTALSRIDPGKVENGVITLPIGVEEGVGSARKQWPVRVGVPFPKGAISPKAAVTLTDPAGQAVPAQTRCMAVWPDNSLRWLLVDFPADVPGNAHVFYQLKAVPEGSPASLPNLLTEQENQIQVNLGPTPLLIPRSPAERLLGLFGAGDLWWTDGKGQRYVFQVQGDGAGIQVEENGPIRAVVRATGWYRNDQGRAACQGELRWEFYRGMTASRLYHTVVFCGSPVTDALGSYGITFRGGEGRFDRVQIDGDAGSSPAGKSVSLYQSVHDRFEATADGQALKPGRRCTGVVQFTGAKDALTVFHRDLWRLCPKKVTAEAAAGTATFAYWPEEAGVMGFMPREEGWIPSSADSRCTATGLSRTHEFILETGARRAMQDYEKLFCEPVVAAVPPRWIRNTWTLLHLSPYDATSCPTLEQWFRDLIGAYERHRETYGWFGEWVYGGIPNFFRTDFYGWIEFGRYAWITNEQDIVDAPWLLYLRSGDRRFLKFAESNTRHTLEVATIRWNPLYPRDVGLTRRHHECIWLGGGDTGHSMLDPFVNYYHATGYTPAWEAALRMGNAMSQIQEGGWRYVSNPLAGCSRLFMETNDARWKQAADRIWTQICEPDRNTWYQGDHGDRAALWYSQLNPKVADLALDYAKNRKGIFTGADIRSFLYLLKPDDSLATELANQIPKPSNPADEVDPFMYPIRTITQYELANARAWCFLSEIAAIGQKLAQEKKDPAK